MSRCKGCGITLQNSNKNEVGYTINLNNKYCERCFKTIHYNEEKTINDFDNSIIISKINKMNYFTIFITDIINLNNNVINIYNSINNSKILVINKSDLIPNNIKLEHIKDNIKNSYNINEDILFISGKKNINLDKIINIFINNKNTIICGETSSGKSTLLNKILDINLTTSKYNNTTLDFIKLKYEDNIIYDSPGIIINNYKVIESINIKPISLKENYIYRVNDISTKGNGNITFFLSNNSIVTSKKDNTNLDNIIKIDKPTDILFKEGFMFIKNPCILYTNTKLEIRDSIIGR